MVYCSMSYTVVPCLSMACLMYIQRFWGCPHGWVSGLWGPLCCCCCCDSPAALLLTSVVQVEEVCNRSRVVPQVLHYKLRRMALTVEQMLYGVWCHSTLRTDVWYAAGNAGLVTVQNPAVTGTQLGESGTDWARQQTFKRWNVGWWSSKDSVWYKIRCCFF